MNAMRDGIVIFDECTELDRDQDELYVDAFLRRLNQAANVTGRDSIVYLGYQRALQLYGNEKAFDLTPLQRLKLHQCTNLEMNRSVARKAGYNPEAGRSAPCAGVYFSKGFILTYPGPIKTFLEQPDTGQLVPYGYSGKQEDLTTSPDFIELMRLTYPNELQLAVQLPHGTAGSYHLLAHQATL
jgi:hypothetical protein